MEIEALKNPAVNKLNVLLHKSSLDALLERLMTFILYSIRDHGREFANKLDFLTES